ncbi:unnamed protein product [Linum trigynum]|uniref:Uncharacterized protein n=1 Tax=Linum trigynum TaxID=586398 RepID=A0AAV2EXH5_9ROSI
MYVTRPLSLFRKHPSTLSMDPPEGPYTGYLVVTDEEAEAQDSSCWGICKDRRIKKLPLPQDRVISLLHISDYGEEIDLVKKLWFLPVLDRPLSSNCYYVIKANGRSRKGQAYRSSRESDMGICCFEGVIKDKKPKPFDYTNIYTQFTIHRHHKHSFTSKSLAIDGLPPQFLRKKGWKLRASRVHKKLHLTEASGLDASLRSHLPSLLDFPIYKTTSPPVAVGKWYCPFVFVREDQATIKEQMKCSRVYRVTLERYWQEIFSCNNDTINRGFDCIARDGVEEEEEGRNVVAVVKFRVAIGRRADSVYGREAMAAAAAVGDEGDGRMVWFRSRGMRNRGDAGRCVGLNMAVVKKMEWVMEEGGWVGGGRDRVVRVEKEVEIGESDGWRRFCCYVLVESFVLRRMDGTLVLKSDFRHTNTIKWRWE